MLPEDALAAMSRDFDRAYAAGGCGSVTLERLVRTLVLQGLYPLRRERPIGLKVARRLLCWVVHQVRRFGLLWTSISRWMGR